MSAGFIITHLSNMLGLRVKLIFAAMHVATAFHAPLVAAPKTMLRMSMIEKVSSTGLAPTFAALAGASLFTGTGMAMAGGNAAAPVVPPMVFSDQVGMVVFACALTSTFLFYAKRSDTFLKDSSVDEACLILDEPICGPVSFDSTEEMTCGAH